MPFLIQKMIIEEMGLDEILYLSVTSKRTCRLLGMSKIDLHSISITVYFSYVLVRVGHPNASLYFSIPFKQSVTDNGHHNHLRMDCSNFQFLRNNWDSFTWNYEGVELERIKNAGIAFGKLLRHLKTFLNVRKPVQCSFRTVPVGLIPQLDCNYIYDRIVIRQRGAENMNSEDLTFLLGQLKIKQLDLNVKVPVGGFSYQRNPENKCLIQKLIIGNHSWMDFSELPAAKVISISKQIPLYQMNTVLKSWIAGRNRDMDIGDFELGKLTNRKSIFAGIESHATQLTEAERGRFLKYAYPRVHLLRDIVAVDIIRENDGMRATVIEAMVDENPRSQRKIFVMVWSRNNLRRVRRHVD
ncbi:hypothetical protein B9Z55_003284 [Caenorhabditis nigoni]|nr:hypothetical protein B9Z55_003284 [Caenorhabditis nigoni]